MKNSHRTGLLISIWCSVSGLLFAQPQFTEPLTRLGFGSCAKQSMDQPIWDTVLRNSPELFVLLGDNIYGDTNDMEVLKKKYGQLAAQPGFAELRKTCPVVATWDDHDYGRNDASSDYEHREASQEIFFDFFEEPKDSGRRKTEGVYTSYVIGPEGKRVQIILLDLRYFRTPNLIAERGKKQGLGDYIANTDPAATMMGDTQWEWFAEQLKVPAEFRIIGSSIQFLARFHGVEAWKMIPAEYEKMLSVLKESKANGVVMLSGDVHWAELAKLDREGSYPLYEMTSSGLTHTWGGALGNPNRVGKPYTRPNFGLIEFDWSKPDPEMTLIVKDIDNVTRIEKTLPLSELSH